MRFQFLIRSCLAAIAVAGASTPAFAESAWDAAGKRTALKWEIGYLAPSAIDAAQTIDCLDRGLCKEGNPLFGKHPSTKTLIGAKLGLGLLHFYAFSRINERNPKAALRLAQISVAAQGTVTMLNARFTFK